MIVYLIGMMGSGKSSVGKLLANKLQFSIIDIDKEIEKDEKLSIKEIFEKKGENYFFSVSAQARIQITPLFCAERWLSTFDFHYTQKIIMEVHW